MTPQRPKMLLEELSDTDVSFSRTSRVQALAGGVHITPRDILQDLSELSNEEAGEVPPVAVPAVLEGLSP